MIQKSAITEAFPRGTMSARKRSIGIVTKITKDTAMAQIEMQATNVGITLPGVIK